MQYPHVRMSVRGMMITVALIGLVMYAVRVMFFAGTVYAPGYDEVRFRQVRVGMTAEEVEALLGPPLRKVPLPYGEGFVDWMYTDSRPRDISNYWKRNVRMKDGKVVSIIRTYWID